MRDTQIEICQLLVELNKVRREIDLVKSDRTYNERLKQFSLACKGNNKSDLLTAFHDLLNVARLSLNEKNRIIEVQDRVIDALMGIEDNDDVVSLTMQ